MQSMSTSDSVSYNSEYLHNYYSQINYIQHFFPEYSVPIKFPVNIKHFKYTKKIKVTPTNKKTRRTTNYCYKPNVNVKSTVCHKIINLALVNDQ